MPLRTLEELLTSVPVYNPVVEKIINGIPIVNIERTNYQDEEIIRNDIRISMLNMRTNGYEVIEMVPPLAIKEKTTGKILYYIRPGPVMEYYPESITRPIKSPLRGILYVLGTQGYLKYEKERDNIIAVKRTYRTTPGLGKVLAIVFPKDNILLVPKEGPTMV